jgi:hypothetical protein
VSLQQKVTQLAQPAQVQNRLTHNAFGEVSEEYDDEVYDWAVEMAKLLPLSFHTTNLAACLCV